MDQALPENVELEEFGTARVCFRVQLLRRLVAGLDVCIWGSLLYLTELLAYHVAGIL